MAKFDKVAAHGLLHLAENVKKLEALNAEKARLIKEEEETSDALTHAHFIFERAHQLAIMARAQDEIRLKFLTFTGEEVLDFIKKELDEEGPEVYYGILERATVRAVCFPKTVHFYVLNPVSGLEFEDFTYFLD